MSDNLDDVLGVEKQPQQAGENYMEADYRVRHKYPSLRTISVVYKVLAVIIGIVAIIVFISGLTMLDGRRSQRQLGQTLTIVSLIWGFILVITFLAVSEGIKLFIDIEENTRRTWMNLKNKRSD